MDSNAYVKSIALIGRELQAKSGGATKSGTGIHSSMG